MSSANRSTKFGLSSFSGLSARACSAMRAREQEQSEHNGKTFGSYHNVLSWRFSVCMSGVPRRK